MFKKWNKTLTRLGLINCVILIMILQSYLELGNGMGFVGALFSLAYAAIFFVVIVILSIKNIRSWFSREMLFSTLLMLLLCTPIPLILGVYLHSFFSELHIGIN